MKTVAWLRKTAALLLVSLGVAGLFPWAIAALRPDRTQQ